MSPPPDKAAGSGRAARLRRRRRAEALSPLWITLLVVAFYAVSFVFFINCDRAGACRSPEIGKLFVHHNQCRVPVPAGEEFSAGPARLWPGRFLWVFFTALNNLASAAAILISLHLIKKSINGTALAGRRAGSFLGGWGLRATLLGPLLAAMVLLLPDPPVYRGFMPQIYDLLYCGPATDLPSAIPVTFVTLIVGVVAVACVVMASCVIIWPARGGRGQTALSLERRLGSLRLLLYAGAATLVTTVLRISVTFHWGLAHLPPTSDEGKGGAVARVMGEFTTAFVSTQAGAFTLILAAIYVPAALVLNRRADAVARRTMSRDDGEKWLASAGFSASFSEHLPRVVAILGPFLAGPLGDLISFLSK